MTVESTQSIAPPNLIMADCESITPAMLTLVDLDQAQIDSIVRTVPGGVKNVQDIYPLAPLQEGMLFHRLLNEQTDTYVLSTLFELQSPVALKPLIGALQKVIDRHDILRTAVLWQDLPRPVQVVYRRAVLQTQELPLDPERDAMDQLRERMRPGSVALDVRHAPIGRLQVATPAEGKECYALLQLHHLICDHQSLKTIVFEALMCAEGCEQQLPAPIAYRNYVADALTHARIEESESFFRRKLAGIEESTAPFELIDVHGDGLEIKEGCQIVGSDRAKTLRTQARRSGISAARLFHAAWALVVAHTTGRDDVVYGTVLLAKQRRPVTAQRMLGMTVNTLPLRLQLKTLNAKELVRYTHQELLELSHYEHTSLALAQRCSGISGTAPLFTAILNYRHSATDPRMEGSGSSAVRFVARGEAWSNYPVALTVDDTGEAFVLTAHTHRRIDPDRVIGYLDTAVHSLAEALEHAPQTAALALSIVPEHERHQLIDLFNATRADYPLDKNISELFEEQVKRTPEAIALVCGDQQLTYAQLNRRSNMLAHTLRARGVGPNERAAVYVQRSSELVIGLLGILKAGGAYVPLDLSYPAERVAYILRDSAPVAVVTESKLKDKLPPCAAYVVTLDMLEDGIDRAPDRNLEGAKLGLTSESLAYVIYTSGATGSPNGVMVEHRNLTNLAQWHCATFELTANTRCSCVASIGVDASTWEIWPPLTVGATLVLSPSECSDDTEKLIAWWKNEALDVSFLPTPQAEFAFSQKAPNHHLRTLLVGGDLLRHRPVSRSFALINNYGPTETTVVATSGPIYDDDPVPHVGRPIANAKIYILNHYGQIVPIGVAGEIYIGGIGVARGYLNRPELTAERFVPNPFAADSHALMYKTGDLGRWRADGTIEHLGRNDRQVTIRGHRIEPAEIEMQLRHLAQVEETVVIASEDAAGERHLVAYIVQNFQSGATIDDVRRVLKCTLPAYMLPSAFVILERLPLTPNGTLDRHALPQPVLVAHDRRQRLPPRGEREETLAAIWRELLGVTEISQQDNFFDLGGHSLLIVQMMELLRRAGLSADLRQVFETTTLSELACVLTREAPGPFDVPLSLIPSRCDAITPQMLPLVELEAQHIEQIVHAVPGGASNIQDIYPLAPLQEGLLFHHLLDEQGADTYVLSIVLTAQSRQRLDELMKALQSVISRHDILRTAILWEKLPQPLQVVYREALLPVTEISLVHRDDPMSQVTEWLKPERQRLDLRQAPLIRMQIASDPNTGKWYVLLQLHHLVCDHVSVEILISEVVSHLEGHTQTLPEAVPYRNHVAQKLAYARTHDAAEFFRSQFGEIKEPTAPFGLLDMQGGGKPIEEAAEQIDLSLSRRLRAQSCRVGVSAATLFHAAWALVVARTSGRSVVVFGTVLLGRLQGRAGAQRILGMFINTLPLRLRLAGVTAEELVKQTQHELTELLTHEHGSLAVAQRCSGMGGSGPLFSALLNYRHSTRKPEAEWSGATGIQLLAFHERTNYPITLSVDDMGGGFSLTAQTDRRIDPSRIVRYMSTAVESLVEALEQAPSTPALELSVLPETERRQVIESFNSTQVEYGPEMLVHELFEEQVRRTPDAIAVVYAGQSLTYAELNGRSNQLARLLRRQGVGPDKLVGIYVERNLEMVVALLGILKAGGAYVPLDPNYPAARLHSMIGDARPTVLLTQECLLEKLPDTAAELISLDDGGGETAKEAVGNLSSRSLGQTSDHLAYVIYTSGSSGQPKGIMIEHRNVVCLWRGLEHLYRQSIACKRIAMNASINFDASVQQLVQLLSGRTIFVVPEESRRDPSMLLRYLEENQIDGTDCTPSQLKAWVSTGLLESNRCYPHMVLVGGEPIDAQLWSALGHCSGKYFYNVYGPTECTVDATFARVRCGAADPHIGRPMENRQVYILDQYGRPAPIGVEGEIYIAGAGVARGYLNRPTLTRERFLSDPYNADPLARTYKTGDLGRWRADGTIEYLGRNDDQVKIRGYRIELGEIEAKLLQHERVKEAAVVAQEEATGGKRLVAYVTLRAEQGASAEELRAHLKATLPEYMVPGAFVVLETLPLMPSGKLNRKALSARQLETYASRQYEAPQGEVEEALAGMWQELLRVGDVGRNDNFFELGGHSLLVLKAVLRINQAFDSGLRVTDVYKSPTIRDLAARICGLSIEDTPIDLSREGSLNEGIVSRPGDLRIPAEKAFVTGATGFVGRFLLTQILLDTNATVYCLIRAQSEQQAMSRLRSTLSTWNLWQDEFSQRIVAIPGDLHLARLGIDEVNYELLCQNIDSIYHCGASMNHLETYAAAKPANVESARELLKLATHQRPKIVNYISTLGVFSTSTTARARIVNEQTPIDREKHWNSRGYTASKWVAEKIFMTAALRGVPCNIFRLGLVWADTKHGRYDELQHVYRHLKSCLLSGYGIRNYRYEMAPTPVDYVARAITFLANQTSDGLSTFHISSSSQMAEGVFERSNEIAGTSLELMCMDDWIRKLKQLHHDGQTLPLGPLLEFHEPQRVTHSGSLSFDCARTYQQLERGGIRAPSLDDDLLRRCLEDMFSRDPDLRTINRRRSSSTFAGGSYA